MASVSFGTFSKRRNSTKRPTNELSDVRTVTLKEDCSQDRPIFKVTGNNFNYNYCSWDGKYYFIDEIISLRNNEIEVHCVMDPLATYKSAILAGTYFVSYSSQLGDAWLADTRIPILKNATVAKSSSSMNFLFTDGGFFVMSAIGKNGCHVYCMDKGRLTALIDDISSWTSDLRNAIFSALPFPTPGDEKEATANLYTVLMQTGTLGNAYLDAPNCIRSCIWVPFFASHFAGDSATIFLGQYDTGISTFLCKTEPHASSMSINIPWQYSDWRRALCEEVYLYLPMVGMISIPSDEVVNETSITVEWSATATDGCIAYRVLAGNQVIGSYGANASANYPIGISQQASAGEILQTAFAGAEKTVSSGISTAKSAAGGDVVGAVGGGIMTGMAAIDAAYQTANTALTAHNSCIGGIGGGAGAGLSLDCTCFTVAHPTVINPTDMKDTMGLPTMKPLAIANLTGFCQLANAHVDAPATAGELDAIDSMINSGFFIE